MFKKKNEKKNKKKNDVVKDVHARNMNWMLLKFTEIMHI